MPIHPLLLRLALLPLALLAPCIAKADTSAPAIVAQTASPAAPLRAQPDAAAALAWLAEHFPPGSYVGDESEFFLAAEDVFADAEHPEIEFFVYSSARRGPAGRPLWIAWLGLDDDWFVVLLDAIPLE